MSERRMLRRVHRSCVSTQHMAALKGTPPEGYSVHRYCSHPVSLAERLSLRSGTHSVAMDNTFSLAADLRKSLDPDPIDSAFATP